MKWENRGHQYDLIGRKICALSEERSAFYIWGAGTFGISFYELFCQEINIEGFIDSDPKKQGTEICGISVYAPEYLKKVKVYVLVSAGWTREIYEELNQLGYVREEDYLHIDDFTSLYHWYKYKKVFFSDISYRITEYCSLKCKECNTFVPKLKNPCHIPADRIMEDFERYFKYVDHVNVLALSGGDAMVHPEFTSILERIGKQYYPDKTAHIEVYSNAVIVPNKQALEAMKKYNVFYRFTDYRPYTNGRQRVEEVVSLLRENGIRYDHVRFTNWLDCGYPQRSNGICGEKNLIDFFDHCDRKSCHAIYQGKALFCGMTGGSDSINYCKLEPSDFFDLSVYDGDRRVELIEYMLGYSEKGYLNYCRMCNGSYNVNQKAIEAGEQL